MRKTWSARRPLALGAAALVLLLGGFGTWSTQAELAGAIISTGQVEVDQNRQIVQHPVGGVVTEILVTEGDQVAAGDVLIRLDPEALQSQLAIAENQLYELMARRGRLEAERDGRTALIFDPALRAAEATRPEVGALIAGQTRLWQARRRSVAQEVAQLRQRGAQIANQIDGIAAQQTALHAQLVLFDQELQAQEVLLERGLTQASKVLALKREKARLSGTVGALAAEVAELNGRVTEIDLDVLRLKTQRQEEAITRLRDFQYREIEIAEQRRTLIAERARLELRAPVAGVVYGMQVFAERAVIRPAEPVLYLVPQDRPLVISSRIAAIHVDQVAVGQPVTLRMTAFDARMTPELTGVVRRLSPDAFTDDTTQMRYYRADVTLDPGEIAKLGERALVPGMPVEVFLRTADRTPLAYLIQPLADYFTKAFRES